MALDQYRESLHDANAIVGTSKMIIPPYIEGNLGKLRKGSDALTHIHRPSTPTGQYGALVAASSRCKIISSAFMMDIEKPDKHTMLRKTILLV